MKHPLVTVWVAAVCVLGLAASTVAQDAPKQRPPVIDMHLHALPAKGWPGGPSFFCPGQDFAPYDPAKKWDPDRMWDTCPNPLYPVTSDEELLKQILDAMDRYNIVLAATSGPLEYVRRYRDAAPKRFLPGLSSSIADLGSPETLRGLVRKGDIAILGEIGSAVEGMSPEDERLEPYFALAEELDVPVAFHVLSLQNVYLFPQNRAALNDPLLLEKMLSRHPKLRIYVMHAGWPRLDEMIALLTIYPQVYAEVAGIDWFLPRKEFHRYLRTLVEAGFGKRIMFGSDAAMWPQVIGIGIEAVESADFLTEAQKRDILYNNAARFLRLGQMVQTQESQQAELNRRGAEAMGFDQQKITHHFRLLRTGGLIEVEANDANDADTIARIRNHLAEQAKRFAQGDFSAPEHTHGEVPPGVPTMVKLAAKIHYEYRPTPRGGKLRISSADPEAVAAVHEFLKYQTEQHHTGDSLHVH